MGGGGYRSKSSTSPKIRIFVLKVSRSLHLLANTYQTAFILGQKEPSRVSFHSVTSDSRVCTGGWARGQTLVHLQKVVFLC